VFYRKDVWAAKGYTVPTNWDDFVALCDKMKKDGLTPIAFADKDGWPAQGTFDILNLRLNGYDFHVNLLTGQNGQKWTDPKVAAVFKKWSQITKYYSQLHGLTWSRAQTSAAQAGGHVPARAVRPDEFKASGSQAASTSWTLRLPRRGQPNDAEKAQDTPIDVYMVSKKSPTLSNDSGQLGVRGVHGQRLHAGALLEERPGSIPTASDADTSQYPALTKRRWRSSARPEDHAVLRPRLTAFAGTQRMQSFLLKFLSNPTPTPRASRATCRSSGIASAR
jgi:multiple sugar transport system substrate-binding protein